MSTITELAKEFETLIRMKSTAAKTEAECKLEISAIEQKLLDAMADEGVQNLTMASGMTLFKRCDKFYGVAKGYKRDDLVEALANYPETKDLVETNYNAKSLRSKLNEIEANGDTLPEELTKLLEVSESYRVGHRG